MPDFDPTRTPGAFEGPPVGAPHETTQPLQADALRAQLAKAAANEQELKPFNPAAAPLLSDEEVASILAKQREPSAAAPNAATELIAAAQEARSHQPAASETDSPSRGMPRPQPLGKEITGGFGAVGEAQYYAIDGFELAEIVRRQWDELNRRIQNDLRFSMAITYPKLTVTLSLKVEGWAEDAGFAIDKIFSPDKQSPLEVARERADEVVFVLAHAMREFDETGAPENPPDRMRETVGLPIPRKQMVQAGAVRVMVDVVPSLDNVF